MKPQPVLCNMPDHVKQAILDFLDTVSKLNLRQCCKDFKDLVDKSPVHYEELEVKLTLESVSVKLIINEDVTKDKQYNTTGNHDDIEKAKEIFSKIIKPSTSIRCLKIYTGKEEHLPVFNVRRQLLWDILEQSLQNMTHQMSVKVLGLQVQTNREEDILRVLPYLKPGILEVISLENDVEEWTDDTKTLFLRNIADFEQWKQAKQLHARDFCIHLDYEFWSHFEVIALEVESLSLTDVKAMIQKSYQMTRMQTKQVYCSTQHSQEVVDYMAQRHLKIDISFFRFVIETAGKTSASRVSKCAPLNRNIIQMCVDSPADVPFHSIMSSFPIMSDILPVLLMKPRPVLCDMPDHIKEKIIALLDTITKQKFGQCSKNFKKLVDKSSFRYEGLELTLSVDSISVKVSFDGGAFGEIKFWQDPDSQQEEGTYEDNKQAAELVSKILRVNQETPITMNTLKIYYDYDFEQQDKYSKLMDCLQEILASRKRQLCVKELHIQFFGGPADELSKVILHLKPIVLESINLVTDDESIWLELGNDVLESEQWKGAKELDARHFGLNLSYEQYEHFEGINTHVNNGVTLEQLEGLIEESFNMPRQMYKKISTNEEMDEEAIRNYLNQFEQCDEGSYIVPIPGSEDHLVVKFQTDRIEIERYRG